jgi:hypothetical protein
VARRRRDDRASASRAARTGLHTTNAAPFRPFRHGRSRGIFPPPF